MRKITLLAVVILLGVAFEVGAASAPEPTACSIVTAADAQKLVGGPLEVKEFAKIPTANGPGTYDSICTYIAKGGNFENAVTAPRLLDLTLHFLNSADEMKKIYEGSVEQYRQMAKAPDAPFKGATITPIDGFGDKAFVLEAVTDPDNVTSIQDGWNDAQTSENGDKCAWIDMQNITLGGHQLAAQPLWSNEDFDAGGTGCVFSR